MESLYVVSTISWPWILANLSIVLIFFQMENLTVVPTIFSPSILAKLLMVSILFSNKKSNRAVSTIVWPWILGSLSLV